MYSYMHWSLQKESSLDQLLEKSPYTILYFYPKNDTPWCTVEAQDFTKNIEDFANLQTQIIWVSRDTIDSHCSFIEKHSLKPIYLSDPDLKLHKIFGARWEKNNYGKIVTGVIRSTFLLDASGKTLLEWKNVRAKWHADRTLKEVRLHINEQ